MKRLALAAPLFLPAASAALLASLALLQGCASAFVPMGAEKYDCNRKENPSSPYCHSFKAVEAATDRPIPNSRFDEAVRITDMDQLTGIAPVVGVASDAAPATAAPSPVNAAGGPRGEAAQPTGIAQPQNAGQERGASRAGPAAQAPAQAAQPMAVPLPKTASLEGMPIRVAPMVQRVWIKRHVDANDMLVGDTYVYREVTAAHWAGYGAVPALSARSGVFPHWPAPTASADVPRNPSPAPGAPPAPAAAPSRAAQFTQPGAQAPAGDMAPVPASETGTSSMPQ